MNEQDLKQVLAGCIEDIEHEITVLLKELISAPKMKAPARRARKITLNLTKLFKKFRKISCEAGLK